MRSVQFVLAIAYGTVAVLSLLMMPQLATVAAAGLLCVIAHLTGVVVPDIRVPTSILWRVCGIGIVLLAAAVLALAAVGGSATGWVAAVMGYGTGNRLKAAGIGIRDR